MSVLSHNALLLPLSGKHDVAQKELGLDSAAHVPV
jgi:hypothetical protein